MLKQQPAPKFKQKDYINFILNNYDCTSYVALKVSNYFNFLYKPIKHKPHTINFKTALEQLEQNIGNNQKLIPINYIKREIKYLIEIEKKQIIDAYLTGSNYNFEEKIILANNYYNNTYKKINF